MFLSSVSWKKKNRSESDAKSFLCAIIVIFLVNSAILLHYNDFQNDIFISS